MYESRQSSRVAAQASEEKSIWYMLPISLLLMVGSIKGGMLEENIQVNQISRLLKDQIFILYAVMAISFFFAVVKNKSTLLNFKYSSMCFLFIYFCGFIYSYNIDSQLSFNFLSSFVVFLLFQFYLGSLACAKRDIASIVQGGMLLYAIALVCLNGWDYLTGNGYGRGGTRFFGTSDHPNFIGMQMAISALILLRNAVFEKNNLKILALLSSLFILAFLMVYASGSRTAMATLIFGAIVYYIINYNSPTSVFAVLLAALISLILFQAGVFDSFASNIETLEVYDRGGVDTRAGAWQSLWNSVMEAPIFGHGELPIASENSWLRGWSMLGIMYPILIAIIVTTVIRNVLRWLGSERLKRVSILVAMFFGLTVGSVFEGYLVDASSLPIFTWFICFSTLGLVLDERTKPVSPLVDRMRR